MNNRKNEYGILPIKEQYEIIDDLLEHRLKNLLPQLMGKTGVDLWVVPSREYNEDPVFKTLVPSLQKTASRLSILVFYYNGKSVECYSIFGPNQRLDRLYKGIWDRNKEDQWQCLKSLVEKIQPEKIGINYSEKHGITDGITRSLFEKVMTTIGTDDQTKIVSAEDLGRLWLETRTEKEIELYPKVYRVATSIIERAFSRETIAPGETTTDDVQWWMHEIIDDLGLEAWFSPDVTLQRKGDSRFRIFNETIEGGDLLHCDIGIEYLTLCTDTQRMAYVLKPGEKEVPKDLKNGFEKAKEFQDIVAGEFKEGKTGNEILNQSRIKGKKRGLEPTLYTHPIGLHGHGIGMNVGLFEEQEFVKNSGEHPLSDRTCYALELNIRTRIKAWDDQEVHFMLEETTGYYNGKLHYLPSRQERLIVVK